MSPTRGNESIWYYKRVISFLGNNKLPRTIFFYDEEDLLAVFPAGLPDKKAIGQFGFEFAYNWEK